MTALAVAYGKRGRLRRAASEDVMTRHSQIGIAAIRFIALSGVRRGECQQLRWDEVDALGTCLALGETKTGPSLRPLSQAAFAMIDSLEPVSDYVFAAGPEQAGYQGLPGLWETVQKTARVSAETAAARCRDDSTGSSADLHGAMRPLPSESFP